MPFDTLSKDLAPVMLLGTGAMVMTAHAGTPYKTFGDPLAAARAKAGRSATAPSAQAASRTWR